MLVAFELMVKFVKHVFGRTNCWLSAARHSTFITRISGHHIVLHEIEIKPKKDDRPAGVCPDVSGVLCTIAIMLAPKGWNIGIFVMQVRY